MLSKEAQENLSKIKVIFDNFQTLFDNIEKLDTDFTVPNEDKVNEIEVEDKNQVSIFMSEDGQVLYNNIMQLMMFWFGPLLAPNIMNLATSLIDKFTSKMGVEMINIGEKMGTNFLSKLKTNFEEQLLTIEDQDEIENINNAIVNISQKIDEIAEKSSSNKQEMEQTHQKNISTKLQGINDTIKFAEAFRNPNLVISMTIMTIYGYIEDYYRKLRLKIVENLIAEDKIDDQIEFIVDFQYKSIVTKPRFILKQIGYLDDIKNVIGAGTLRNYEDRLTEFRRIRNIMSHGSSYNASEYLQDQVNAVKEVMNNYIKNEREKSDSKDESILFITAFIKSLEPILPIIIMVFTIIPLLSVLDHSLAEWSAKENTKYQSDSSVISE